MEVHQREAKPEKGVFITGGQFYGPQTIVDALLEVKVPPAHIGGVMQSLQF